MCHCGIIQGPQRVGAFGFWAIKKVGPLTQFIRKLRLVKVCLFALKVIEATITDRLQTGINVGGRNYRVLGGSNSLVSEHGYYVCASYEHVTAESIRKQIGMIYIFLYRKKAQLFG